MESVFLSIFFDKLSADANVLTLVFIEVDFVGVGCK